MQSMLCRGSTTAAEEATHREKQRVAEERAEQGNAFIAEHKVPPKISGYWLVLVSVYVPVFMFISLLFLFTVISNLAPVVPWFVTILFCTIVFFSSWPAASPIHYRTRWDWFPILSGVCCISCGVFAGLLNRANMEPYYYAQYLHQYDNVLADNNPKGFADAGIINFADGVALDLDSATGFRNPPHMYCAAPIVQAGTSAKDANYSVGFWAVGINCCSEGSFTCGAAKEAGARSGLRTKTHSLGLSAGQDVTASFEKALRKAAALHDFHMADEPVLLTWSSDPGETATLAFSIAWVVIVALSSAACCCGLACLKVITKVQILQQDPWAATNQPLMERFQNWGKS